MSRVWRRESILVRMTLSLASRIDLLFPDTGTDIPFELVNRIHQTPEGVWQMTWERAYTFPHVTRRFVAIMTWDEARKVLIDDLGAQGKLVAELHARTNGEEVTIQTGKQWMRLGSTLLPIPRFLAGDALIREWPGPGCTLRISVTVRNPLLGEIFGYEGSFERVETGDDR